MKAVNRSLTMSFAEFCADPAGGISEEYGYRYLRKYKDLLPPVNRLPGKGRKIYFRRVDVENWLANLANAAPNRRRRGRPTKASQALLSQETLPGRNSANSTTTD